MTRRVLYLCTTFPRLSEKFVEREVTLLSENLPLDIRSLWKGGTHPALPVKRHPLRSLLRLFYLVPLWLFRKPATMARMIGCVLSHPPRSFLSAQEVGLGLGMGILLAEETRRTPSAWIHAIWATAPATTAWIIHLLTGLPYSFGAHAYDLFQDKGDPLLCEKIATCSWIRTSTESAARELGRLGAPKEKIVIIRRGLDAFPVPSVPRAANSPLHLLSIGRLVPKKGFLDQIAIFSHLKRFGVPFIANIVGDGPLRRDLENAIHSAGLERDVHLLGAMPYTAVEEQFGQADLFLFTGRIYRDGDRDGLPNVVAEAMAHGIPVVTRAAAGVCEAVHDHITGVLLQGDDPRLWARQIDELWQDPDKRRQIAERARQWVESNFSSQKNTRHLVNRILASMEPTP